MKLLNLKQCAAVSGGDRWAAEDENMGGSWGEGGAGGGGGGGGGGSGPSAGGGGGGAADGGLGLANLVDACTTGNLVVCAVGTFQQIYGTAVANAPQKK